MQPLIIHPKTQKQLNAFISRPSHALGLVGNNGSGKLTIAKHLAGEILNISNLDSYPYNTYVGAQTNKLGIEEIRQLNDFLSLKVPRPNGIKRSAIIENAQTMTIEAQNALLKTLEEPPEDTLMLLTFTNTYALLPTILSRLQTIVIKKPEKKQLEDYLNKTYKASDIAQAYIISGGLVGLMSSLLSQPEHPLMQATAEARVWLKSKQYERLIMVDKLSRQKELTENMIYIFQQMSHVSLQTANASNSKRWQLILDSALNASEALTKNSQPKLVLTNLALAF